MPDFYTIFLLVLLFGLSNCVIWAAIVSRYRSIYAARYWLAASVSGVLGGLILSSQGNSGFMAQTIGGNTLVILGFWLNYLGVRHFHGDAPNPRWAALVLAVSAGAMLATFHLWYGRNPLYTLAQSLPLFATLLYLLRRPVWELGAVITTAAMAVACIANWVIASGNALLVINIMPTLELRNAAAIALLVFLFASVTWNFGFLISVIDKLHRDVERLANEDELTGWANRRLFMKHLEIACARSQPGRVFSVMLFDLDRFKSINDTHGHAAGDAALKHFADISRATFRSGDIVGRLGGDEFCVLLPDAGRDEAAAIAERVAAAMKARPFQWRNDVLEITTSIGIASSRTQTMQPDSIMEEADLALYETKRRGRNGFTIFVPDSESRQSGKVIDLGFGVIQTKQVAR